MTCTPLTWRKVSNDCPACGGMTTVKLVPLVSVPLLVPPAGGARSTVFTLCAATSDRNWE